MSARNDSPGRVRRRRAIAGVTLACLLFLAATAVLALAQPPQGITRPAGPGPKLSQLQLGAQLFAANCSTCHGPRGEGISNRQARKGAGNVTGMGPSLRGVGALATDFYLRTGYMPLAHPGEQPTRSRSLFNDREIKALVAYVSTFGGGPAIPTPDLQAGDLGTGQKLFTEHCSGCHQVVAQGGVVTGAKVPPLEDATARQVAEAVRIGPYLMPRFSERQISDADLNSIVRYVMYAKHPDDRGGWGIGNLGPFPEGIVTWLIAAVALVGTCMLIGERLKS